MKQNIAKSNYDKVIDKQPPKIMKLSKLMNVISIICGIVFITFLVLKFTKVWAMSNLIFWSPLIVLGTSFIVVIICMMTIMLKDGVLSPSTSISNKPQQNSFASQKQNCHKHTHTNKGKKRKKH